MGSGPGVVVIHEIPGITPQVAAFARRVADRGMTAVLPVLFGTAGKPVSTGYVAAQFAHVCISREFAAFAKRRSSPVTVWLRALCRDVHQRCGGPGVGVIGMCATGGFALAMMADPSVIAPVLSQPSLPLPITAQHRGHARGFAEERLRLRKSDVRKASPFLGSVCRRPNLPPEGFATLREEFEQALGIEIDSSPGNAFHIPPDAHSVVTADLVDEAGHPMIGGSNAC